MLPIPHQFKQLHLLCLLFCFCLEGVSKNESYQKYTCEALDFKGEAVAFKATSSGILEILKHCIEVCYKQKIKLTFYIFKYLIFFQVMNQRETAWESMLEKEINNRKDLEEVVRTLSLVDGLTDQERAQVLAGADLTVCITNN